MILAFHLLSTSIAWCNGLFIMGLRRHSGVAGLRFWQSSPAAEAESLASLHHDRFRSSKVPVHMRFAKKKRNLNAWTALSRGRFLRHKAVVVNRGTAADLGLDLNLSRMPCYGSGRSLEWCKCGQVSRLRQEVL
jgi:hypothetical protein